MEYRWCVHLGTLGVGVVEYGPYAILNLAIPFISILYAITGFTIVKLTEEEKMANAKDELKNEELSVG